MRAARSRGSTLRDRARRRRRLRAGRVVAGPRAHRRRAHRRHHRPPRRRLRPARRRLRRPHGPGHRLRPRPPDRGRHRGGRRARRGDERRQLEHPRRPRRPGELRHRAGRRPHLRPAPGRDLPAPRDHDRRHRGVDDRPGPAPADPGGHARPSGPTRRPRSASSTARVADGWAGHPLADLEEAIGARVVGHQPDGRGDDRRPPAPSPRPATCCTSRPRRPASATIDARPAGAGRRRGTDVRVVIAGGGSVGRFIAEQLHGAGHDVTILDNDTAVVAQAAPLGRAGRASRGSRATPASSTRSPRRRSSRPTSSPRSPATTRTTSSSRCWPSRSSACRGSSPGSTTRRTSGCSTSCGASTSPCRRRTSSPALVEEAVSVGSFVRLLSFEGGKARLAEVRLAEGSPADGKQIVELGVPRDATVVAVLRADRLIVPRGDTVLRVGDEVVVLVTDESEEDVRALLVAPADAAPERPPSRARACRPGCRSRPGRRGRRPRPRARSPGRGRCRRCAAGRRTPP